MSNDPLLVPMTVEALVVNDAVRAPKNQFQTFLRTQMTYTFIQGMGNGQPFTNGNDTNFTKQVNVPPHNVPSSQYYNGVYLKWRLPKAFTSGTQDNVTGMTVYPLVPNRWLIVRLSGPLTGRQATAWIVESDYVYPPGTQPPQMNISQNATLYTQPASSANPTPQAVKMGRNVQLGSWTELGTSLGLTSMGPGNPAFAFYQSQCNNVFSFVDPLYDVPDETLSYQVFGWFSSSANDPLNSGLAVVSPNSLSGYGSTLAFTESSAVEVAWSAGTLTGPNDTVLNIAAGNTGAMVQTTYIYLNPSVSTTALAITTDIAVAQAPGCAIIATAEPFFVAQMAALGWTLPTGTDPSLTAVWSLLLGQVNGVAWQSSQLPPSYMPDATKSPVTVAVGNTSIEALTALISNQAAHDGVTIDAELLEAFQLNQLDVFDRPDGSAVLAEKLRASFFQRRNGGYSWTIVDAPDSTSEISPDEQAKETAWLATLNQDQQALDAAEIQLAALQRQLYLLWWKYQSWGPAHGETSAIPCLADNNGNPPAAFTAQLDPTVQGSLASQVLNLKNSVATLFTKVPSGSTPDQLDQAIAGYAAAQQLPATRQLKRGIDGTYFLPNNPVVLLAGAGSSGIVQTPSTIQCRFPSQAVTGFNFNSSPVIASTPGISIPQPSLTGVSGVPWLPLLIANLVNEFYFLDPNNAASVAAAIHADPTAVQQAMNDPANDINIYPAGGVQNWIKNPWHPLLMFWQANYYPIAYGTPQAPNWLFEGNYYAWNQTQASVVTPPLGLQGLSQLSPTAAFNMQSRIQQFLNNNPSLPPEEIQALSSLLNFVQTDDQWDLLSQQLDGFNEQLQLGTPGVFLSPAASSLVTNPTLASLIGQAGVYPPIMPPIPLQNQPIPPSRFQPWRAGQFEFTSLLLVDEWGQAFWPFNINSYQKEIVYLPPDLSPVLYSNPVPFGITSLVAISNVQPGVIPVNASGIALTVTGANFASGAQVSVGGTQLPTTVVSPTELTAQMSSVAQASTLQVTVTSGGNTSNALPLAVTPTPGISALSPNLYQAGMVPSDTLTVTVTGFGFASGALVTWNGTEVDTTVVNATTLNAAVPASYLFAHGVAQIGVSQSGATTNTLPFTVSEGAAIGSLSPSLIATGSAGFTLTVNGVGFAFNSVVNWNGFALTTTYISGEQLTASVPPNLITGTTQATITESVGSKVLVNASDPFIQLPPALLQPARLAFDLVSATSDNVGFGPANPQADPIAGWVLPNHLDNSLMAYNSLGTLLGEMSVGVNVSGTAQVFWTPAPFSPYATLPELAAAIPHFGPFLLALYGKTPEQVLSLLTAIDETIWTTVPVGASFDQNLAILVGRPLAMVRARLQFQLQGAPYSDPSWPNTFSANDCSQLPPPSSPLTGYEFGIELGNIAQLDDGLIGYFIGDDYDQFNVVAESGAGSDGYLTPIGVDNNYLYQPFDGTTQTLVSMLIDPRAPVHATTAILPDASVAIPLNFASEAISKMNVTFRVNGLLTDQKLAPPPTPDGVIEPPSILMPVPKLQMGNWTWLEQNDNGWSIYPTGPVDTVARLSEVAPVLRRGMLRLSSALQKRSLAGRLRNGTNSRNPTEE